MGLFSCVIKVQAPWENQKVSANWSKHRYDTAWLQNYWCTKSKITLVDKGDKYRSEVNKENDSMMGGDYVICREDCL